MNSGVEESDKHVIRLAMQGDSEAFTQLVRNYKHYVYQTAVGILADKTEAEDVSQEAFVRAYSALSQLRQPETFPTWIATITTRIALDSIRRRKREVPIETPVEQSAQLEQAPIDEFARAEGRIDLLRLLRTLSTEERTVMILRELQDRSYADIANILDIPIGTVRSRLHSARKHLRQVMKGGEGDKHVGM